MKVCQTLFYVGPQLLAPHSLPTLCQYSESWVQSADNEPRPRVFSAWPHTGHTWVTGNQIIIMNNSSHHVSTPVRRSSIRPVLKYMVQSLQLWGQLYQPSLMMKKAELKDLAYSFTASKKRSQNVNAGQSNNSSLPGDGEKSDRTQCLEDMWQDPSQFWGPLPPVCGSHQWKSMLGVGNLHARNIKGNDSSKYLFDFHDFWVREGEKEKSAWTHSLCPQWHHLPPHLSQALTLEHPESNLLCKTSAQKSKGWPCIISFSTSTSGPTDGNDRAAGALPAWLPAFDSAAGF